MAPNEARTRKVITRRQLNAGYSWLGNASEEEYEVAAWMEEHDYTYIYQADFTLFSGFTTKVDFQVLGNAPPLVLFVQGDKWHQGMDQRIYDREQELAVSFTGATVVEIWGHQILQYPGFPTPTDASFDRVMALAMEGQQVGNAWS